ncbi:hypothetical protein ACFXNW_01310 [Nocardia sp. NPDC059180]|uniref:hypothetical protein n=1 Tax=Nocardia sp. NPDC059180 TaxID=3346761 RepID=UPI0036A46C64
MSDYVAAFAVAGAVAVLLAGLIYALPYMLARDDDPPAPASAGRMCVQDAHEIMQDHRRCSIAGCPDKRDAYRTLVDARVIVPDARAERYMQ